SGRGPGLGTFARRPAISPSLWWPAGHGPGGMGSHGQRRCRRTLRAAGGRSMIFSAFSPLLRHAGLAGLTRDALLRMDPETAHGATIAALRLGLAPRQDHQDPPELATSLCGLDLTNPLGMAAGFDKNAEVPRPLALM